MRPFLAGQTMPLDGKSLGNDENDYFGVGVHLRLTDQSNAELLFQHP